MELILTGGRSCLIDVADYPLVKGLRWAAIKGRHTYYALIPPINNKGTKSVYMHRLLLNAPPHLNVDHINMNGLDNRRSNLRLCTPSQNQANRGACKRIHQIPYKGVYKAHGKYRAAIVINGRKYQIGESDSAKYAAIMYDAFVREFHGAYGRYNFPKKGERGISDHE